MKQETQCLLTHQQATQSENEILAQLCNGTLGEWLEAIQSEFPHNIRIKECITDSIHSTSDLKALMSNLEAGNSYFFMPCFELSIDSNVHELQSVIEDIKEHFQIHETNIQDKQWHFICEWYEGAIVSTSSHIRLATLDMHTRILKKLNQIATSITTIAPTIYIGGYA